MNTRALAVFLTFLLGALSLAEAPYPSSAASPLHWAARRNEIKIATVLLAQNPKLIDSVDGDGRTPLHFAAAAGSMDVLRLLIKHGANIDAQSNVGVTPLLWAMEFRDLEAFNLLLANRPNLELARHEGGISYTPLAAALHDGPEDYADQLIRAGANVNATNEAGWTPLLEATFANVSQPTIRSLVDRGAKINARNVDGNSSLSHALLRENFNVAKLLIQQGSDLALSGYENRHEHDNCQMNPAGWAARGGDVDCMKLVLAFGADPRLRDGEGRDALQIACEHRNSSMEAFLVQVFSQLGDGWTSRHFAAEYAIRSAFARPGPSLDSVTRDGLTPLMITSTHGDLLTTEALLRAGCDPNRLDARGESALDKAVRLDQTGIAALLLSKGARGRH